MWWTGIPPYNHSRPQPTHQMHAHTCDRNPPPPTPGSQPAKATRAAHYRPTQRGKRKGGSQAMPSLNWTSNGRTDALVSSPASILPFHAPSSSGSYTRGFRFWPSVPFRVSFYAAPPFFAPGQTNTLTSLAPPPLCRVPNSYVYYDLHPCSLCVLHDVGPRHAV